MRFFTRAWCTGGLSEEAWERAPKEYASHLEQLMSTLPVKVQAFAREVNLHDGLFREVVIDRFKSEVTLRLRCGDLQVGYFDLDVTYQGADLDSIDLAALRAAAEAPGTEILHDELDVHPSGRVIHSIIFSPEHEVSMTFDSMHYTQVARPSRDICLSGAPVLEVPRRSG